MQELSELVRQYGDILDQEHALEARKDALRSQILELLESAGLRSAPTPFGSAKRCVRFRLTPRPDEVLRLLDGEDLLPFAHFSAARVKEILVPKYARERLLPLFDVGKWEYLEVRRGRQPKPYG